MSSTVSWLSNVMKPNLYVEIKWQYRNGFILIEKVQSKIVNAMKWAIDSKPLKLCKKDTQTEQQKENDDTEN